MACDIVKTQNNKHVINYLKRPCVRQNYFGTSLENILKRKRNATVFNPLSPPHGSFKANFLIIYCVLAH